MASGRDFCGYGSAQPTIAWPDGKRLALSLVVNYEEGGEMSVLDGDAEGENETEWGESPIPRTERDLAMESMFEYGSRVGVWRILEVLKRYQIPATFFAVAKALERNPAVAQAAVAGGHEICSHGLRWEEVFRLTEAEERQHIAEAVRIIEKVSGAPPVGWYCRYGPSVNTRRLLAEHGGFLYDSDAYNDDVPYYTQAGGSERLVLPYTADINDMQWWFGNLTTASDFFSYAKDSLDALRLESKTHPKMMSVGLHCRIIGKPGRIEALGQFIEYAASFHDVWIATRSDIAKWWHKKHTEGLV